MAPVRLKKLPFFATVGEKGIGSLTISRAYAQS